MNREQAAIKGTAIAEADHMLTAAGLPGYILTVQACNMAHEALTARIRRGNRLSPSESRLMSALEIIRARTAPATAKN